MGKYSNVSVSALSSAVNQALSELGRYDLQSVTSNILSSSVLQSSVNPVLSRALSSISSSTSITGSIAVLRKKLQSLVSASNYIKKYQDLEKEIKRLEMQSRNDKTGSIARRLSSLNSTLRSYESTIDGYLRG